MKEILLGVIPSDDKKQTNIKGKSIFTAGVARWLLKRGNRVIDIKPDKQDKTKRKTVFIFEDTPKLKEDLSQLFLCQLSVCSEAAVQIPIHRNQSLLIQQSQ